MPSYTLDTRLVIIGKETNIILTSYEESLTKLKSEIEALNTGDKTLRPGLSPRLFAFIEKVYDTNIKAHYKELPSWEADLDPPGLAMLEGYIDYLSGILKNDDKVSSADLVKQNIDDPLILVYELLIRLVVIALDTRIDKQGHDGGDILRLIQLFVEKLKKTSLLDKGIPFLKKPSHLSRNINSTTHDKWIIFIQKVVDATKILHKNNKVLHGTLMYFSKAEEAIKMHIIAELDPSIEKDDIHHRLLNTTFINVHKKMIQKNYTETAIMDAKKLGLQDRTMIINSIKDEELSEFSTDTKKIKKKDQLNALYTCLENTSFLKQVANCFDLFNILGGWILILADVLNIDELAKHIKEHGQTCTELLEYEADSNIFSRAIHKGLKRYDSSGSVLNLSREVFNSLKELISNDQRKYIAEFAENCFRRLDEFGKQLGCSFINVDKFQQVMGVAFTSYSLAVGDERVQQVMLPSTEADNVLVVRKPSNSKAELEVEEEIIEDKQREKNNRLLHDISSFNESLKTERSQTSNPNRLFTQKEHNASKLAKDNNNNYTEINEENFDKFKERATVFYDKKDFQNANKLYKKLLKFKPDDCSLRLDYSYSLISSAKEDEAIECLEPIIGQTIETVTEDQMKLALFARAAARENKGNLEGAEEDLRKLLAEIQPKSSEEEEVLQKYESIHNRLIIFKEALAKIELLSMQHSPK